MPHIVPFQRAIGASAHTLFPHVPVWLAQANPLERLGIAAYDPEALEEHAPLTPLEALVAASHIRKKRKQRLAFVHSQHPELSEPYLKELVSSERIWRNPQFAGFSPQTQLLIGQHAAFCRRLTSIADPHGQEPMAVMHELNLGQWLANKAPSLLRDDPMLQRILACRDNDLLSYFINAQFHTDGETLVNVDNQARGIAFLQDTWHRSTPQWYDQLDDDTFSGLVMHDPDQGNNLSKFSQKLRMHPSMHQYPWGKMHLIMEHHPARFFASIVSCTAMSKDIEQVKRWFPPMLDAVAKRIASDPHYAVAAAELFMGKDEGRAMQRVLKKYAPKEAAAFGVLQSLHTEGKGFRAFSPAMLAWTQWLAQDKRPVEALALPDLGDVDILSSM